MSLDTNDTHNKHIDYLVYGTTSLLSALSAYACYRYVQRSSVILKFMNSIKPISISQLQQDLNENNEFIITEVC